MNLWIPDSPDFEILAGRLLETLPDVPIRRGISPNPDDVCVLELQTAEDERMVQVSGGGRIRTEYRHPRDMDLLVEDIRLRMAAAGSRADSSEVDAAPDVPDLDEEVFTLGGLPARALPETPEHSMDGVHAPAPENAMQGVPEVPEDAFALGTPVIKQPSENISADGPSGQEERGPEQTTSPGILRRNTIVASVEEIEQLSLGGGVSREFTIPQWDGNMALFLLDLHRHGFSGQVEVSLPHFRITFSWANGRILDAQGIAPILARLLQLGADGIGMDLTRTLSDPIEWALRRRLIASGEERQWALRCRREAVRLAISARRAPVVTAGSESASSLPPLDPRGAIFGGILEHMGADEACALCDAEEPRTRLKEWDELFADPDFDPVWLRALHLFGSGSTWEEACIRSGMGTLESWKLAYACRLFGLIGPTLPANPATEIRRRRFRRFEESLYTGDPAHVFGNDPVAARRLQQDILLQFSQLPAPLRLLLSGDFEKLKKSMDKALSLLSF